MKFWYVEIFFLQLQNLQRNYRTSLCVGEGVMMFGQVISAMRRNGGQFVIG